MKDLPKVYEGKITNKINNTQEYFYSHDRNIKKNNINVNQKINNIFSSKNHVYKSRVIVYFKDGTQREIVIVGKTNTSLITIKGELFRIIDIVDIDKI